MFALAISTWIVFLCVLRNLEQHHGIGMESVVVVVSHLCPQTPLLPISRKMVTRGGRVSMGSFINVSPAIPASHAVADEVHYSSSFLAKNGAKLSHQQPLTVDGGQWHYNGGSRLGFST